MRVPGGGFFRELDILEPEYDVTESESDAVLMGKSPSRWLVLLEVASGGPMELVETGFFALSSVVSLSTSESIKFPIISKSLKEFSLFSSGVLQFRRDCLGAPSCVATR